MPGLDRPFLQMIIQDLLYRKEGQFQWLVRRDVRAERIANFGCSSGNETLALVWVLGAHEAVGIDKDELSIHQAQNTLMNFKDSIVKAGFTLENFPHIIPEEDKRWWTSVPSFFKKELIQEVDIDFAVRDITKPTGLPSDFYDVAFCDFVLNHIWFDQERRNAQEDTQFAVGEMARVIRTGGLVAAFELIQFSEKPKSDLRPLFEQAGLRLVHTKEMEEETWQGPGVTAEYLYKKP